MSEQLREALSAIVDGEASEFELRRVLDEMGKDEGLLRAWQSYHLIRQAASGENVAGVSDMGERIWAALDSEEFLQQDILQVEPETPELVAPAGQGWGRRGLFGGAIAAALALGVFLAGDFGSEDPLSGAPQIAGQSTTFAPGSDILQPTGNGQALYSTPAATGGAVRSVAATDTYTRQAAVEAGGFDEDYDYGPGFVPASQASAEDRLRNDGYFLLHVQHQAVNDDNVLSFVKMISYPQ